MIKITDKHGKDILSVDENGDVSLTGELRGANGVFDGGITVNTNEILSAMSPKEIQDKVADEIRERCSAQKLIQSANNSIQAEQEIYSALQDFTRREAMNLLSRIKTRIISDMPHDCNLDAKLIKNLNGPNSN